MSRDRSKRPTRTMAERKQRATERTLRRNSLNALLARMLRGALLDAERPLLHAHIATELDESDNLRSTVQGMQAALNEAHARNEAADAAIVEAEQDAAEQRAAVDRVRALAADMRTWCSPRGIATQYADDIEKALDGEQAPAVSMPRQQYRVRGDQVEFRTAPAADARRQRYGQALHRWGLLDEVNDPAATEAFAVTDLLAVADEEIARRVTATEQAGGKQAAAQDAVIARHREQRQAAEEQARIARGMLDAAKASARAERVEAELAKAQSDHQAVGGMLQRTINHHRERAERAEAELSAARSHAAEQGKVIARLLREIGNAEQATAALDSHRRTLSDALGCSRLLDWDELSEWTAEANKWATREVTSGRARKAEQRADRNHAAWRSARRRAAVLSAELTRRAPLNSQYAAAYADMRKAYADMDARTALYGRQLQTARAERDDYRDRYQAQMHAATELINTLRATEDDLADARRRLNNRGDCCDCPHEMETP